MSDWHPIVRLKIDGRQVPEGDLLRLTAINRMGDGSLIISFQTEKQKLNNPNEQPEKPRPAAG